MTVLLDTDALIGAALGSEKFGQRAKQVISDPNNVVLASAASAWEIATKVRIGKLPEAVTLEGNFMQEVSRAGYKLIAIHAEDALRAGRFVSNHRDPFDRIIAAQALGLDIPVLSSDRALDTFGVRRIW